MQDELDRLIDGALAEYANPEPLAGLEQRVIRHARAAKSRRRWWWAAAAIPVAAVLLLMLAPRPKPTLAPIPVVVVATAPRVERPAQEVKVRRPVRRRSEPPKRATFPTARPLSGQERLLIELAKSHPEELLVRPPDVIEVKPIEIAPLDIDARQ